MLKEVEGKIIRKFDKYLMCVEAWGENALRIRVTQGHKIQEDIPNALEEQVECKGVVSIHEGVATIVNGKITCNAYYRYE